MISFKQFLNEDFERLDLDKLKEDCAFFLNLIKGTKGTHRLYHGTNNYPVEWALRDMKYRQGSRDTPNYIHEQLNRYFEKRFGTGYDIRNWMFGTGLKEQAMTYGSACIIFPVGKFKWVCPQNKDLQDMTKFADRMKDRALEKLPPSAPKLSYDEKQKLAFEEMVTVLDKTHYYVNEDLVKCLETYNEINFSCSKYYIINAKAHGIESRNIEEFLKSI
jgi:hypothetical protein